MAEKLKIPTHLSTESRRWYAEILKDFDLESHHKKLLQAAAECWDRAGEARRAIAKDGLTHRDRHGNLRPHPAVTIERDNKTLFARLLRELALDVSEPESPRPPAIHGNSASRRED